MITFIHCMGLLCAWTNIALGQTWNDTKKLKTELLNAYDATIRPVLNQSQSVVVNVSLMLLNLQDIDEVSGRFSITGYTRLAWRDEMLTWDPVQYGSISEIVLNPAGVWVPPLTLTNPFTMIRQLGNDKDKLRVMSNGTIVYTTGDVFHTACGMDITYYPFDFQMCQVIIAASDYKMSEVMIRSTYERVITENFMENTEWNLRETEASTITGDGTNSIMFTFNIERKSRFIVINVILPLVFMSFINLLVFVLPSDSGERVGYAITVLLSIAVFLTIIGDNLPRSSDPMPILSNFLLAILIISVAECIMAITSLYIYHKEDDVKHPPRWLQNLIDSVSCKGCSRRTRARINDSSIDPSEKEKSPLPQRTDMSSKNAKMESLMWRDISPFIDKVCLFFFVIITLAINAIYMYMLKNSHL